MKKILLGIMALGLMACGSEKKEEKKETADHKEDKKQVKIDTLDFSKGMPVAYVNMDTLNAKYERLEQGKKELEEKYGPKQKKLELMEQSLISDYQKYQENARTMLKSEMEATEKNLASRDQRLKEEAQRLQQEMMMDQQNMMIQNEKNLSDFLEQYCEENGIEMVFSYRIGGELLYSKRGYDITNDVVEGMNKKFRDLLSSGSDSENP